MNKDIYKKAKAKGRNSRPGLLLARASNVRISAPFKVVVYIAAILILIGISNLFQDTLYGSILIVLYGFVAIILRVKSENTFRMVLILLAYIIVLVKIKNELLAENFAQYAFLLLLFGVIGAVAEERERRFEQ